MREIKFRAWHKNRECFVPIQAHFSFDTNGELYQTDYKPIELMQDTGLKDKNGVEIYEGDIVQDDERPVECGVVEWDYDSLIVNNAKITPEWRKTSVESGLKYRHWIVIGNIYENPELLDKD